MMLEAIIARLAERAPLPDGLLRAGIARRVARTRQRLGALDGRAAETQFARAMAERPIAEHADAANAQHYELPPAFFALVLGPSRKYSCCLYQHAHDTLADAEALALSVTAERAQLADGQAVLELGCGWGALSLWMAERFPGSVITAVSNSRTQGAFIVEQAQARELPNLHVVTADMNGYAPGRRFDRVVAVEMFEHMANWPLLFERLATWLTPDGRAFLHVFSHRAVPYRFNHGHQDDWIARHFFTGGIMPSHGLVRRAARALEIESEWRLSGTHYGRTARHWLANFDRHRGEIRVIFDSVYGAQAPVWMRRWRLFFLATAGLFGHQGGNEWGISHYRLRPPAAASAVARSLQA
jgi:cyclopropane-fatty-acyl-phospholipid synthase